jgi:hypothetical protein
MPQIFANNATSVLDGAINATQTSITLADTSSFPVISDNDFFRITLTNAGYETNWEIIQVTSVIGNVIYCVRGMENTVPLSWEDRSKAELRVTAESFENTLKSAEELAFLAAVIYG